MRCFICEEEAMEDLCQICNQRLTLKLKKKPSLEEVLIEKYGMRCFYCGKKLNRGNFTIDHIKPVSKGGEDTYRNLVPACKKCNEEKADKELDDYCKKHTGASIEVNGSKICLVCYLKKHPQGKLIAKIVNSHLKGRR